jgi:DNA modification methylase
MHRIPGPTRLTKFPLSPVAFEAFGFTNPILIDGENGIVAGHARLKAAQKIGLTEVPTIELSWLTPAEKQAYIIADNQTAIAGSGWDAEMLRLELGDLKELGFDLTLTGFDEVQLGSFLADKTEGLTDPDDSPALPEHPVTQPGDLWLLGRHRMLCGDSTVATDVERVLGGVEPHLMVTDPPYGVSYDPKWRETSLDTWEKPRSTGKVDNDDRADWSEAWALFPGHIAYVWHGGLHSATVAESLQTAGFVMRAQIIWAKQHFVISRGDYHWQHEPCWYAVRKGSTGQWVGDRKQSTLWQIQNASAMGGKSEGTTGHGTQKPVECMRRPIENNSSPGQAVYEPFSGSGTTIIAAEMTGRVAHAIEIAPTYVDVAVKRWQSFSGKTATLDGDGRIFAEVATHRTLAAATPAE